MQREDLTWEPKRKINNAIGKLCGRHPVELMLDDLRQNNAVKSYVFCSPHRTRVLPSG